MISAEVQLPEELNQAIGRYLDAHHKWDYDRVIQNAIALFLLQNGKSDKKVNSIYLDTLLGGVGDQ